MKNFTEQAEKFEKKSQNENLLDIKKDLTDLVGQVRKMQKNKNLSWEETKPFRTLIAQFGEAPPLSLLESLLNFYKEKYKKIIEYEIPLILQEAGVESITLETGEQIKLQKIYSGKINDEAAFFSWFESSGYNDLVDHTLNFKRGEWSPEITQFLEKQGASYTEKEKVHHKTLSRIIKERIEAGEELPPENVLKLNILKKAVIKD